MVSRSNKGQFFEEWINQTNAVYEAKGLALIRKIPTPWKIQRKYNPYNRTYEIAFAYPEAKSTVDYGGTAGKYSIWFEAKCTNKPRAFPLTNIHQHQHEYLQKVNQQGGKAFFLIHSEALKRTWLLWIDQLCEFTETNKRKSIPFEWLEANCPQIQSKNGVVLDYLPEVLKREG